MSQLHDIARACAHLNAAVVGHRPNATLHSTPTTLKFCRLLFEYGLLHSMQTVSQRLRSGVYRTRIKVGLTLRDPAQLGRYGSHPTVLQVIQPLSTPGRVTHVDLPMLDRVLREDTAGIIFINTVRGWLPAPKALYQYRCGGQLLFRVAVASAPFSGFGRWSNLRRTLRRY